MKAFAPALARLRQLRVLELTCESHKPQKGACAGCSIEPPTTHTHTFALSHVLISCWINLDGYRHDGTNSQLPGG